MITKEFIEGEINNIRIEAEKARVFLSQCETGLSVYAMLLSKFDPIPEETKEKVEL